MSSNEKDKMCEVECTLDKGEGLNREVRYIHVKGPTLDECMECYEKIKEGL